MLNTFPFITGRPDAASVPAVACHPRHETTKRLVFSLAIVALLLPLFCSVQEASADIPARLRRIDIKSHPSYTRLIFQMDRETPLSMTEISPHRVRLTFPDTDGPLFRRLRGYADNHMGGVVVAHRGDALQVTVGLRSDAEGVRLVDGSPQAVILDIGPAFKVDRKTPPVLPGRESIWKGAERFIREFDAPLKSDLPFIPTESQSLHSLLNSDETKLFLLGEAALYKGRAAEAAQIFETFLKKESGISALAAYRCGEARYLLQDYPRALQLFREGERLWPQYLAASPATTFYYADTLVRNGDFPAGRKMLTRLIASQADKKAAPILLVRLADILAREKRSTEANLIYQAVVKYFPNNKAASHASLELADSDFLSVDGTSYVALRDKYRSIAENSGDFDVREEACFKATLLDALFGPGMEALQAVSLYEKHYPRGIFVTISHSMHEELLPVVYRDLMAAKDGEGLIKVAEQHADYLAKCLTDPVFIKDLDRAYIEAGQLQAETLLFGKLVRRDWAAPHAEFMYTRILDNALTLADWPLAETSAREFLRRFPAVAESQRVREILGDILYRKGDLAGVQADLAWVLEPKAKVIFPTSYYYLGKALESVHQEKLAGRAMESFIAALRERQTTSPLAADACFVVGTAQLGAGNLSKAMAAFRAGLDQTAQEGRDRFYYRIGDLCLREGRSKEARGYWEKIIKEGNDAVWQKLATQAMSDLDWRERTGLKL